MSASLINGPVPPSLKLTFSNASFGSLDCLTSVRSLMMIACMVPSSVSNGLVGSPPAIPGEQRPPLYWLVCAPSSIDKHRQFRVCKHLQRLTSQDHGG